MKQKTKKRAVQATLIIGSLFITVQQSISATIVSGKACVHFAGQSAVPQGFPWNETDASIPPFISVSSGDVLCIGAMGA